MDDKNKNQNSSNSVKLITVALYKKSKRTFSHCQRDLIAQAKYFSPIYRDFIVKIIQNNSLKIELICS